ncbi:hypothetical protein VFPFJ_06429 [Purpureocillium lilacinum]|uniref:Uncharacterized protein n=1 Tax=Purpureocillium lilacinum TaxID=33203 RepID=A0A179HHV7_PURLI|nr:hypothetical protein VFPFJ_06429 [Purpureocillium lilacinum]OAQ90016.1 hypothetical protein VFPFJ_06429 [Purpureocillium lilacinum]
MGQRNWAKKVWSRVLKKRVTRIRKEQHGAAPRPLRLLLVTAVNVAVGRPSFGLCVIGFGGRLLGRLGALGLEHPIRPECQRGSGRRQDARPEIQPSVLCHDQAVSKKLGTRAEAALRVLHALGALSRLSRQRLATVTDEVTTLVHWLPGWRCDSAVRNGGGQQSPAWAQQGAPESGRCEWSDRRHCGLLELWM